MTINPVLQGRSLARRCQAGEATRGNASTRFRVRFSLALRIHTCHLSQSSIPIGVFDVGFWLQEGVQPDAHVRGQIDASDRC
jgi:hypothetical protein